MVPYVAPTKAPLSQRSPGKSRELNI